MKQPSSILLALLLSLPVVAQDAERAEPAEPTEEQAQVETMLAAVPGARHVKLARIAGEYTTTSKFMADPDADVVKTRGSATITKRLGGRFLLEENDGEMLDQPIGGLRMWGYNNASRQYEAVWTFTMSTAMMLLTGISEDGGKTIDWVGTYDGPDAEPVTTHVVTRFPAADRFVVEVYHETENGTEFVITETVYERK